MQEPVELGPPSAAVMAAGVSSPALALTSVFWLVLARYQVDRSGGICSIGKFVQDPGRSQKKSVFIVFAKLVDFFWIGDALVAFIAGIVLPRYGCWSLALAFGIHRTLSQVSLGTYQAGRAVLTIPAIALGPDMDTGTTMGVGRQYRHRSGTCRACVEGPAVAQHAGPVS